MEKTLFADHPVRQWLIEEIYVSDWIFFDGWSLVHLVNGFILGFILSKIFKGLKLYLVGFLILVLYEIWENASGQMIFSTEQPIDYTWDLIIGMTGIIFSQVLLRFLKK